MRPTPHPNDDEIGTQDDLTVADPLSTSTESLWTETARQNREVFSEIFKTVPCDAVKNWDQYDVGISANCNDNYINVLLLCRNMSQKL